MSTTKKQAAAARAAAGDREELRAALTTERAGYVARGLTDRVKQVDAQLKRLGTPQATPQDLPQGVPQDPPPAGRSRRGKAADALTEPEGAKPKADPEGEAGAESAPAPEA